MLDLNIYLKSDTYHVHMIHIRFFSSQSRSLDLTAHGRSTQRKYREDNSRHRNGWDDKGIAIKALYLARIGKAATQTVTV